MVKYFYNGTQRVAMKKGSTVYFLLGDHLGSTTLTTNSSGTEVGELRYPSLKSVMAAQKMPVTVRNAQQSGVDVSRLTRLNVVSLSAPPGRKSQGRIIAGETPEEAGANLALALREARLL